MKVYEILGEGLKDDIKSAIQKVKKYFASPIKYTMPSNWQIEFDATNSEHKNNLDPVTWQIAFMAGDMNPEISAKESFNKAYYGGQLPFAVEEKTWDLAHAAGVKHSKS